jgi:RHS repeat-associated protein
MRGTPPQSFGVESIPLAETPSESDLASYLGLPEPLLPMGAAPEQEADTLQALSAALRTFQSRMIHDDLSALEGFLDAHGTSRWALAVHLNLGILAYNTGQFSKALSNWKTAWEMGKSSGDPAAIRMADRAIAEYALMNARIGRQDELRRIFTEIGSRTLTDTAALVMERAREGESHMTVKTETAFRCGPYAVEQILARNGGPVPSRAQQKTMKSPRNGFRLDQVAAYARDMGWDARTARRSVGAAVIVPSVVHWKVDHFGALIAEKEGRYLLKDPTFGNDIWISRDVLDREASGFFLIPDGPLPTGWAAASNREASGIRGKGATGNRDPGCTGGNDKKAKEDNEDRCNNPPPRPRMADYNVHAMLVSLTVFDYPVGYAPPVGPEIETKVVYNQKEAGQPTTISHTTFGPRWECEWVSYLEDNPLAPGDVTIEVRGGGSEVFSGYDYAFSEYKPHPFSRARLRRTSHNTYERLLPDGSKEVFAQYIGTTGPQRKIFLSKIIDPYGNAVTLEYDAASGTTGAGATRIKRIYDAINQITNFTYKSNTAGTLGYYRVHKITDPFGRFAEFVYDNTPTATTTANRLTSITDVIGIVSSFEYDSTGAMTGMVTPYGRTAFAYRNQDPSQNGIYNWLQITDPQGDKERVEYIAVHNNSNFPDFDPTPPVATGLLIANFELDDHNTFFWSKKAMRLGPGDYEQAKLWHWARTDSSDRSSRIISSWRNPFESRVWYNYPGQTFGPAVMGTVPTQSKVARVLDDGSSQVFSQEVDDFGNVTKFIDPLEREHSFLYAGNGIDLLEVRQTRAGANDLLFKAIYNDQHLPLKVYGANGRFTSYTYNARGQVLTITNPKNEITTLTYNTNGYLTQVDGPQPGAQDKIVLTYDTHGRVQTLTRHEGPNAADIHTLTYEYDNLDRIKKVTYPDTTYEETSYTRLDAVKFRDREGRITTRTYTALRQVSSERDPLGRINKYEWCRCGALQKLTDALGRETKWTYDAQGRLTRKTFPDNTYTDYVYEQKTSRLKSMTDALGTETEYAYNIDNTLASITYDEGSGVDETHDVTYAYDPSYNRLTSASSSVGATQYAYYPYVTDFFGSPSNHRGRLMMIDGFYPNDTQDFTYDELGRVFTRRINGSSNSETFTYDASGRITHVANNLGTFIYAYAQPTYIGDRLASMTYPNGQITQYDWKNNAGDFRLSEIKNLNPAAAVLSQFNYNYSAEGKITQWTQAPEAGTGPAVRYDFGYDPADQIRSAVLKNDVTQAVLKQFYYGYDPAGNRVSEQIDGGVTSGAHNNLNQLTGMSAGGPVRFQGTLDEPGTVTINGTSARMNGPQSFEADVTLAPGTHTVPVVSTDANNQSRTQNFEVTVPGGTSRTLSYDANGNLLDNGAGQTYKWDAANRMTQIIYNGGADGFTQFTYDAEGRRVRRYESDGLELISHNTYIWQGLAMAEERENSGQGPEKRYFSQGFQRLNATYSFDSHYYTKDHLGSIREVTDANAAINSGYDYDPYGRQETSLPTGMKLWLKADAGVTKDANDKVSGWADQSGNSNHAAQTDGAKQPTWIVNAINNQPVLRFGGTDDHMQGPTNFNLGNADHTLFCVHRRTTPSHGSAPLSFATSLTDNGAPTLSWIGDTNRFGTTRTYSGWGLAKSVDLDPESQAFHVSSMSRQGGTSGNGGSLIIRSAAVGGLYQTKATQNWTSITGGGYYVGVHNADHTINTHFLTGDVAEVIVFERALTPAERTRVESYLAKKYARSQVQSDFRYTGHYHHERSGLTLAPYRAYDANLGRWLSRDPIEEEGGINLYQYVLSNPINWLDPLGLALEVSRIAPTKQPTFGYNSKTGEFSFEPASGPPAVRVRNQGKTKCESAAPGDVLEKGDEVVVGQDTIVELRDTETGEITRLGPNTRFQTKNKEKMKISDLLKVPQGMNKQGSKSKSSGTTPYGQ